MAEVIFPFDWRMNHLQPDMRFVREILAHTLGITDSRDRAPADAELLDDLVRLFERNEAAPGRTLEKSGQAWKNVYVLEEGIARLYRQGTGGKVCIHHFFREGDVMWPVFARSRSPRNTLCMAAVENCILWSAPFDTFRRLLQRSGHWARFALVLTEQLAEQALLREVEQQTLSALDRYRRMVADFPELVERVPDYQLASWLGVASATFSRLKHQGVE